MEWYQVKQYVSEWSGLSQDALHIYAAVAIQLGAVAVFRSRVSALLPWLAVLLVLVVNEWLDLRQEVWPRRSDQYLEALQDLWNTMLLPTILLITSRYVPRIYGALPPDESPEAPPT